jgi:hypothetical protein
VRASSSAATPVASAAPICWKISSACRRPAFASAVRPVAKAQRPRPASARPHLTACRSCGPGPGPAGGTPRPGPGRRADPVQRVHVVERLGRTKVGSALILLSTKEGLGPLKGPAFSAAAYPARRGQGGAVTVWLR